MIEGIGLSKSYGSLQVLKSVNVSIKQGEIVSITGPSGAGKSTLLQLLGTLDHPQEGEVLYNGEAVSQLKSNKLAAFRNKNIGFIFQFHHLLPEFTAIENVCMPGLIQGISKKEAMIRASELLHKLGLGSRLEHKPNELSGGEQQRVAIARSMANRPGMLFADEPTGNLDAETGTEVINVLLALVREHGTTLLAVTHDAGLASRGDRILYIEEGLLKEKVD